MYFTYRTVPYIAHAPSLFQQQTEAVAVFSESCLRCESSCRDVVNHLWKQSNIWSYVSIAIVGLVKIFWL